MFGRTLDRLKIECNTADIHDLNAKQVKDKVVFVSPPENGKSVGALACELLELRDCKLQIDGFSHDEIDQMLSYVCTS